jgi:hypothetical protein
MSMSLLVGSKALSYLLWRNALSNRSAKTTVIKGSTNPPKNGIERIMANDTNLGSTDLLRTPRIALFAFYDVMWGAGERLIFDDNIGHE